MIISTIAPEYFPFGSKEIRHSPGASVLVSTPCNDLNDFAKLCLDGVICAATCAGGVRSTKHFQSIPILQFDFDNGTNPSEVAYCVRGYNHAIIGSSNHMKDKQDGKGVIPRFHLFIELDTPITDPKFYKFVYYAFAKKFAWKVDKSCSDLVRYFVKHSQIISIQTKAKPFPLANATEHYRSALAKPKPIVAIPNKMALNASLANYLAFLLKKENRFSDNLFQKALGKLLRAGATEEEAYNFLVSLDCLHDNPKHPINTRNARKYIQWAWRTWGTNCL